MSEAAQAIPANTPVMVAWKAWRASPDGQAAIAALTGPRAEGLVWLAFFAGWDARKGNAP